MELVVLLGYGYSLLVGHFMVSSVVKIAHSRHVELVDEEIVEVGDRRRRDEKAVTAALGYLESAIFTSAWLAGHPEFIAVWLVLKTAGSFTRGPKEQRSFNTFVVGTGLSVLFGVTGAVIIELANDEEWMRLAVVASAPVVLAGFLGVGIRGGRLSRLFFS